MNTKRSMVVLFAVAVISFSLPGYAFAAETLPETIGAEESMSFNPFLYATVLLAAITLCAMVASAVFALKYWKQKEYLCKDLNCHNNPLAQLGGEGVFDYRQIETPQELLGLNPISREPYSELIDTTVESSPVPVNKSYVEAKSQTAAQTVSRSQVTTESIQTTFVSVPLAATVAEFPLAAQVHENQQEFIQEKPAYVGKHQRRRDPSVTPFAFAASAQSKQLTSGNQANNEMFIAMQQNAVLNKTARLPRIGLVEQAQETQSARKVNYKPAHSVPAELEYLLRKIS